MAMPKRVLFEYQKPLSFTKSRTFLGPLKRKTAARIVLSIKKLPPPGIIRMFFQALTSASQNYINPVKKYSKPTFLKNIWLL
ncbi:MAG: hypothetical protein ACFCVD_09310 [Nodosilinea sp.]